MKFTGTAPVHQPSQRRKRRRLVVPGDSLDYQNPQHKTVDSLRLVWDNRRLMLRIALYGLVASTIVAFLIPSRYESTARLMPPENQSGSGLAMAAAAAMTGGGSSAGGGLSSNCGRSAGP